MARPDVGTLTDRLFDRLPELYRAADEAGDWPLLRFLSGLLDQASTVEDTFDRIDVTPVDEGGAAGEVSELVDPTLADAAWLPWLAQLVGIRVARTAESYAAPYGELSSTYATYTDLGAAFGTYAAQAEATTTVVGGELSTAELRTSIASASEGWRAGSTDAIVDLLAPLLTGTQTVKVVANVGGDPWLVHVRTYEAETPEPWLIERALSRSGMKPAGVVMEHNIAGGATYGELDTDFGTYADMSAGLGTYEAQRTYVPAP